MDLPADRMPTSGWDVEHLFLTRKTQSREVSPECCCSWDICPQNIKCKGFVPLVTPSWGNSIRSVCITSSLKRWSPWNMNSTAPPSPSLPGDLDCCPKPGCFLSTVPLRRSAALSPPQSCRALPNSCPMQLAVFFHAQCENTKGTSGRSCWPAPGTQ